MKEKILCSTCKYRRGLKPEGNTKSMYFCYHPNREYILKYFLEKKIKKFPCYLGFGNLFFDDVQLKSCPAWCPRKAEHDKEFNEKVNKVVKRLLEIPESEERKMRKCKGKYYKNGECHEFEEGVFHQWGTNCKELCNVAIGTQSVAIVELPNGEVVMPIAYDIQFLTESVKK